MSDAANSSEKYPSQDDATGDATNSEQAHAAAAAERHAAPVPAGGAYPPRGGPSVPLGGPYPPAPYPQYQPYPPSYAPGYRPAAPAPYPPMPNRRQPRERQRVAPWVVVVGSLLMALAILMAGCFVVAGVLQGMVWSSAPASATETHSFTVTDAPTVTLRLPAGNLHIVKGGDGAVTATLYKEVHAITHSAAQQVLDDTTLTTSQTGNDITLTAQIPSITANFTSLQRDVDLTISVPASANLNLTVNAGNADITGIDGALDVTMNAGNLTLRSVTAAGNSSLRLNAGNVDYLGAIAASGTLDISVDAGNATVHLPPTTPTRLAARASAGNITANGWTSAQGSMGTNTTSHGGTVSLDLNAQPTNTLTIQVSFGNITVSPGAFPQSAPSD